MLQRWHHAPWWVVSIETGAVFAAVHAFGTWWLDGGSHLDHVAGSSVGGVLSGLVMGPVLTRTRPECSAVPIPPPGS